MSHDASQGGIQATTGEHPGQPPLPDRERGVQRIEQVYHLSLDPTAPGDFNAYTVDHLFGDVWNREALDIAARRLITIGVLATQGHADLLELQFDSALENGELSEAQVREVVLHLAHYAGWPNGAKSHSAAERVIARRHSRGRNQTPGP